MAGINVWVDEELIAELKKLHEELNKQIFEKTGYEANVSQNQVSKIAAAILKKKKGMEIEIGKNGSRTKILLT